MANKKNRPDEIDELAKHREQGRGIKPDTGKNMPLAMQAMGRWPMVMVVIGMLGALAAMVALFTLEFHLIELVYYVPGLGISALLIFGGIGRLRNKTINGSLRGGNHRFCLSDLNLF